jgi:predicted component of type VI protein secretion system
LTPLSDGRPKNYRRHLREFDNFCMAYLILSTDGHEWDRRELRGPVVIGRSPDCDISVHDILLSRRHCRFTPMDDGWLVIDLASRNGTLLGEQVIEQSKLNHGDVIQVGKTKVSFRTDVFVPMSRRADRPELPPMIARDELLAGTVAGMTVPDPMAIPAPQSMHRPSPKPRPMDPVSFESDNLYSMLEQIASSSWDSIYATNSQPIRMNRQLPQPIVGGNRLPRHKLPMASLSLQVIPVPASAPKRERYGLARRTWRRLSQIISRIKPAMASPV